MKHPERVEDYLEHIVEAIDHIASYLEDITEYSGFEGDPRTRDAVVRNLEIIGEAATRIRVMDPEYQARHPELPWVEMRGMRNKMIHGYFDVDWEVVWQTARNDLPSLRHLIDTLLKGG